MPSFIVTWTIDLNADTPLDAAKRALEIHRDPGSAATVFMVTDQAGVATTIDPETAALPRAPLKVVFRMFPDGDVIALICGTAVDCRPGNVMSYMHIGQHSEASRDAGRYLRLATPEEYAPLQKELADIHECEIIPVKRLVA